MSVCEFYLCSLLGAVLPDRPFISRDCLAYCQKHPIHLRVAFGP